MPDEDIDKMVERLNTTHTISSSGSTVDQAAQAKDTISKGPASKGEVDSIVDRLHRTHTFCSQAEDKSDPHPIKDTISTKPLPRIKVEDIIERLHSSDTQSSSGTLKARKTTNNAISRAPASTEELDEIYGRLHTTHTKSSKGGEECRPVEHMTAPGYGLPMFPVIDGIEKRFHGHEAPPEKVTEVITRMTKAQTKASQARLDNAAILLYPERTLLMNNVERIHMFQESGALVKQAMLQQREKWYF